MADDGPSKNDIQLIFKRLRSIPTNKSCFDCNAKNPTWSSVTYGVFICIDCSAVHRSLGVHLTFVRSTQLDTNWTWLQIRQMQLGGNANALQFFRQHNCTTTDAQQKYNSRAAQLYKEKLHAAAVQAMRIHGTKLELSSNVETNRTPSLHLESSADNHSNQNVNKKEVDFFEEHTNLGDSADTGFSDNPTESNFQQQLWNKQNQQLQQVLNGSTLNSDASLSKSKSASSGAPSVDALLSPTSTDHDRKPTIGTRKPLAKRTGLGAKKGLGAQKVKGNFEELEREAELADQRRLQEATAVITPAKSHEEQEAQLASMRLAYQDLGIKQKKEEEKLKAVDPKKAQQIERLGMGFASRIGISHSAISDMKTIDQETPYNTKSKTKSSVLFDPDNDVYFDDFNSFTSSVSSNNFSMYKNSSPTGSLNQSLESMFLDHASCSSNNKNKSSVISSSPSASTTSCWETNERNTSSSSSSNVNKPSLSSPVSSSTNEAQKKFGSAKAISSDQYFGDSRDSAWEQKTNLSRFEGSTSISSADYFGRTETTGASGGIQTPDLEEVKESVRQGVTKVAGKLSSLANGVMSSISRK
ncbi:ADP-ribosylation factor GTPase activating protein 3 isoform X2 [Lycorma delicatula]|uniref:ADP-ribosylation factor GTPase activating protein 3 isoform X2 n=1 Tax=Lycorma delicatula TaxID=130591 RepID=UPI003F5152E7